MQMIGSKVQCVGKRTKQWDNGDVSYEVQVSNGLGGIMTAGCNKGLYEQMEPFKPYDVLVNVDTNGYKHFIELEQISPCED